MKIKSWRGWEPSSDNLWLGADTDIQGQWAPEFGLSPRQGNTSVITTVNISPRPIGANMGNTDPSRSIEASRKLLLQRLNPLDTSEGELIVTFNDNPSDEFSCMARFSLPAPVAEGAVDVFDANWIATDPLWHAETVTTEAGALVPTPITNPTFETNTTGWTAGANPASVTAAFARDAAVYFDAAGSGKLTVTVNGGAGGDVYIENDDEYPCVPGQAINVRARVRTTNNWDGLGEDGIAVQVVNRYYTSGDVFISEYSDYFLSQPADTWETQQTNPTILSGDDLLFHVAPATTAYMKIGVKISIGAAQTGTVYFDNFEFVTGPVGTATPFEVEGNAPTHLKLTATPAGNFPQAIVAHTFSYTNDGTKSLNNHPRQVLFDDNSASTIAGDYWALLRDGKPQPCELAGYNSVQPFLWMVVGSLQPGETAEYTLLVSDQTVLPGFNHTFNSLTAPAFDIGYAYVETTSGPGSSTTFTKILSGIGSEVNRWIGGYVHVLSGTYAGEVREISASTSADITHAAFPGALGAGIDVLVMMSSNARWVYPVRKTERSGAQRGLWWLSSGQKEPSDYSFAVPGAWAHDLYYDNEDIFNQKPWTSFNPGGTNDYVSIFDANRRWAGSPPLKDDGGADGVAITLPVKITAMRADFQWKNPNSMCMLVVGSRQENGATSWTHEYENTTAYSTLTNVAIQNITFEPDTYAASIHVIPNGGDVIGEGWAGDNGSATSASSTTLTDTSKEWIADQFIGGTVRIISGTSAGSSEAITDNGTDNITVASWSNGTPDDTSRYVITNKDYVATGRNHTYLHLTLDQSAIVQSSISAATPAFVLYRDILINTVDGLGAETEWQRVRINPETTGRYIVLFEDESFIVDGEAMNAYITIPPQWVENGTSVTLNNGANSVALPTGTQAGDTVIAHVRNTNAAVLTPPAGMDLVGTVAGSGSDVFSVYVGISDGNSQSWTYGSAPSSATIVLVTYRGLTNLVDSAVTATTGTTHNAGPVTATENNSLAVHILFNNAGPGSLTGSPVPEGSLRGSSIGSRTIRDVLRSDGQTLTGAYTSGSSITVVQALLMFESNAVTRSVSPWAYSVVMPDDDGYRASPHWLRVNPGDHSVMLAADESGVACEIDVEWRTAVYS